jgi:hypothetical protein
MRLLANICGLLIIGGGLVAVLGAMARRASKDWTYQLRVIRALALVAATNSPGERIDLWEVELVEAKFGAGTFSVAFSPVNRPRDVGVLLLDAPLGEFADRCTSWCDARTPLLLSGDAMGDAVVHGPDGCLVGRIASWRDPQRFNASLPW